MRVREREGKYMHRHDQTNCAACKHILTKLYGHVARIDSKNKPTRVCVQANLARPDMLCEVLIECVRARVRVYVRVCVRAHARAGDWQLVCQPA